MRVAATYDDIREMLAAVRNADRVGLDTESSGPLLVGLKGAKTFINVFASTMTGYSVAVDTPRRMSWYVPMAHRRGNAPRGEAAEALKEIVTSKKAVAHNSQHEIFVVRKELGVTPIIDCSMVGAWLVSMGSGSFGLKEIAKEVFGHDMLKFSDVVSSGGQFSDTDPRDPQVVRYACEDAEFALRIWRKFEETAWPGLMDHYERVEKPFMYVLEHMHRVGMSVDVPFLRGMKDMLEASAKNLVDEWEFLTGGVLITSPSQVAKWAYGEGGWPREGIEIRKNGMPTVNRDAMLTAMARLPEGSLGHDAAKVRLDYQEIHKIGSTYTESLIEKAQQYPDGRLHPSYHHTGTATGRLSCSYPNLQNIPTRTELGKTVRKAFVAREGYTLVSADYSQIELRVLAHLAGDGALRNAYMTGADIHQQTSDMLGITRQAAKVVNFLIVYGGGPTKLGKTIGVSPGEASNIIRRYFDAYPEVNKLRSRAIKAAEDRGYIRTLLGRRRMLPGISMDGQERWRAERLALNTPIQGGARDIMTMAMLDVYSLMPSDWYVVNQVHDDLILEVPKECSEEAKHLLKTCLEGVGTTLNLRVPLVAEPVSGDRWSDHKS